MMTDISVIKMIVSVDVWHGWMTNCGRGRDLATPECFGRGSQGTIFVRSSKISLFFPEFCSFRRVFRLPRFCKNLRQTFERWSFWFRQCLGGLFETLLGHRPSFLWTPTTTSSIFFKNYLCVFKAEPVLLAESYDDPQAEQSILVMVRRKLAWKLHFRVLARSSAEEPSIVIVIGTNHLRWSMVQKRKKQKDVSVWLCEVSTLHYLQNQRVLKSLFPRPDVTTVLHFTVFVIVDVQLQVGQATARGQRRKAVIRDISGDSHRGVTNLSASICFPGERHCTVFRHMMQLWLLVLS